MMQSPAIRVVVTASRGSMAGLVEGLRERGAEVAERPLIRFAPPVDWAPFEEALASIRRFKAVAVTSPRAALALIRRLPKKPCPVPAWTSGSLTATVLRGAMTNVHEADDSESEGAAEGVAAAILRSGLGSPVFFPCGDIHRTALVARLESAGVKVEQAVCYRTILASPDEARTACHDAHLVVVASPGVARILADGLPSPERPRLLAAGRTTAQAAEQSGWRADAVAARPTAEAVLHAFSQLQTA